MKTFIIASILFFISRAQTIPPCSSKGSDLTKKCFGQPCAKYTECQSYVCAANNTCTFCNTASDIATNLRCEGISCNGGGQCNLGTCVEGFCDTYGNFKSEEEEARDKNIVVIVMPIVCGLMVILIAVVCIRKARDRRLAKELSQEKGKGEAFIGYQ